MESHFRRIFDIAFDNSKAWKMEDKEEFGILLSAPSCFARGWNLNYIEIDNIDYNQLEELLKHAHISDRDSLLDDIEKNIEYGVGSDYEQFISFWNDTPCFDITQLGAMGKNTFCNCMNYAERFKVLVGENGFWAWDYSETIQLIRMGFMKEWITYDEANAWIIKIAKKTLQRYDSWKAFAISYICGGTYFMYKNFGFIEEEAERFYEALCEIVQKMFSDNSGEYWNGREGLGAVKC